MKRLIFLLSIFSCTVLAAAQTATTDEGVEINGVIWATRNVDVPGTFVENPEDFGMFYQWNRAVGWSSTDPRVNHLGGTNWNGTEPGWSKSWETSNNVCPAGWRIPDLYTDFDKLYGAPTYYGELNGIYGQFYEGSEGKTLFLPAAGVRVRVVNDLGVLYWAGQGYYWSSTSMAYCDPALGSNHAFAYLFYDDHNYIGNRNLRDAYSIRCVKEDVSGTSLTYISNEEIKIYTRPHIIVIENAISPVSIYNTTGQLVAQGTHTEFSIPTAGIYIVRVSNHLQKVIVP